MNRLSHAQLLSLRAHWRDQEEFERTKRSQRALRAGDVLAALDELIEMRRRDAASALLQKPLSAREALGRLLDACGTMPSQGACPELVALRTEGWIVEAHVGNNGLVIEWKDDAA